MTVWITKYALTKGILEIEAKHYGGATDMIKQVGIKWPSYYHGEGRDWHRTRAAAESHALAIRDKKIAALKKQIAKLEKWKP